MNELFKAASELQRFLDVRGWPNAVIGGLAVVRWGETRATRDVDVALYTGFGSEEPFVDEILARFPARVAEAKSFALLNRVLLVSTPEGVDLDIALGGIPFEERLIERASTFDFGQKTLVRTCSAEDLIVLKAFANRHRDWTDVEGLISRRGDTLDWQVILDELTELVAIKDEPSILDDLLRLRRKICRRL